MTPPPPDPESPKVLRKTDEAESDRSAVQAQLDKKSRTLASVLSSITDFVYSFDRNGAFLFANEPLLKLWGLKAGEEVGKTFFDLPYPAALAEKLHSQIRQVFETGHGLSDETEYSGPAGTARTYEYIFTPMRGADGSVEVVAGSTRDITAMRQIETALRQAVSDREESLASERAARGEAEKISQLKDDFLATLSHELRTPLNAILGWTHILKEGDMNPDEMKEGLAVIERNTRIQTQLIENLLDMNRIVAGKIRLEVQQLDIVPVVEAAIDTVRPAAGLKNIRIKTALNGSGSGSAVMGDRNRLQQVIWNLLSNAIKFTPKNGLVQVAIERIDSRLEISVSDTGKGINQDFLPHVFDRFRQADSSTTRHHGGLGLGLSIVKQLVELHGGEVSANSQGEGLGATFVATLPLAATHSVRDREEMGKGAPEIDGGFAKSDLTGVKVLTVDDEPDALGLVTRLLRMHDAEVRTASSMKQALEVLQTFTPHVIVSDIGMPEYDGYEFIKRVRALPHGGSIPAVALTALARPEDKTRALRAGFQTHITKPVEPAEILAVVASLFSLQP